MALLLASFATPARASASPPPATSERPSMLVITEVSEGELDQPRLEELEAALRSGLARGEFDVLPKGGTPSCADAATGTAPCAAQAASEAGATHALLMTLRIDRRDYRVTLQVIEADGSVKATASENCEVCGLAEVRDMVENQAAAIRDRLNVLQLAMPTIDFESTPAGALIWIDDSLAGQTPFERTIEPGAHRVRASLQGYVDETQEIEAIRGVRTNVRFDLEPVPRSVRFRKLRHFGWTALGLGVAGLVTGPVLIAIDGRENRSVCSGENVDPLGNCKYLYATLEAGIATAVVGAALLATGIGIALGTRDKKPRRTQRANLRIGPGSLLLQARW